MNILNINKFHYQKGGSETCFFNLSTLLKENGHNVAHFSMKTANMIENECSDYFIDEIDYTTTNKIKKIWYGLKMIWSSDAKKKLDKLLKVYSPDIAHLHLFHHHFSPSILYELKKYNIPMVYTAHDLKLLCGNYMMLNHGEICEACSGGKHTNCLKDKCRKNSISASAITTIEMLLYDKLKTYEKTLDAIITPSKFYQQKFIEYGYDQSKVHYIPNYVNASQIKPNYTHENYILFFGRLSQEKGVLTLINAMEVIKDRNIRLLIVGDGPKKEKIQKIIRYKSLSNIEMLGYKTGKELAKIISNAMCVVLPSEWYENAPLSLLEAYAYGKPVIGSNIGGIPELIEENKTGFVFEPGNSDELAEKIVQMSENDDKMIEMGQYARKKVEKEYNKEQFYKKTVQLYTTLLNKTK